MRGILRALSPFQDTYLTAKFSDDTIVITVGKRNISLEDKLIISASKNPKYQGREVVIVGNKMHILSTKNIQARVRLLTSLVKKCPGATPMVAYIPRENTLILVF
ncbi:hypothetical protein HZB97_01765 [Candidatus Gottesmanbacteria bacterium]|nr:hypothetical protein [Candidatus Gottesmanbacteria bacterium]